MNQTKGDKNRRRHQGAEGEGIIISCFDLSIHVGIATGPVGGRPMMETWHLIGHNRPQRLLQFEDRLDSHFTTQKIDLAFYEAPMPIAVMMAIGSREETVQFLRSAIAILEAKCARFCIPVDQWQVQKARKAVAGHARFAKGTAKRQIATFCRILGYAPADEHQADALIGFLYESSLLRSI